MTPPVFLKDGDSMELSIDNLGRQNIKVLAE
jgi:2-keto-4-pentenoate hydratase/2-oxohepta-3-ene-1,7-dioic acid hydratase in catechol pathway